MYSVANVYSLSTPAEIISNTNVVFFLQNVDRWGKMRIKLHGMSTEKLEAGKPKNRPRESTGISVDKFPNLYQSFKLIKKFNSMEEQQRLSMVYSKTKNCVFKAKFLLLSPLHTRTCLA